MKPLLAIECATDVGSVAVGVPGAVRAEVLIPPRAHAAQLPAAIDQALEAAGVTFADLGSVVVSDGPGSFTGLRIGAATALGIVRARPSLTLRLVPSLVGAAAVGSRLGFRTIAVLYDALRGEVFAAICRAEREALEVIVEPTRTTPEVLVSGPHRPDITLGDGAIAFGQLMRDWSGRAPVAPDAAGPRASALIDLARSPAYARAVDPPHTLALNYGRQAEAQVKWERHHGRPLPDQTSQLR